MNTAGRVLAAFGLIATGWAGLSVWNDVTAPAPEMTCDHNAASPRDMERLYPSVYIEDRIVDIETALVNCRIARDAFPNEARFAYQLGRVEFLAGQHERAASNFEHAQSRGHALASATLGELHVIGKGVGADLRRARALLESSVHRGNPDGKARLGELKLLGRGGEKDSQAGLVLLEDAARAGELQAMINLALAYRDGVGIEADIHKAIDYLSLAANGGSADAMLEIGHYHLVGRGVSRDYDAAYRLFRRAADIGAAGGLDGLGLIYMEGLGVQRDERVAVDYFRKAAENGDTRGMRNLAISYYWGHGDLETSPRSAARWMAQAALSFDQKVFDELLAWPSSYGAEFWRAFQAQLIHHGYSGAIDGDPSNVLMRAFLDNLHPHNRTGLNIWQNRNWS